MTSKLSTVMSQLTTSQLSLSELRKTDQELREQITTLVGKSYYLPRLVPSTTFIDATICHIDFTVLFSTLVV